VALSLQLLLQNQNLQLSNPKVRPTYLLRTGILVTSGTQLHQLAVLRPWVLFLSVVVRLPLLDLLLVALALLLLLVKDSLTLVLVSVKESLTRGVRLQAPLGQLSKEPLPLGLLPVFLVLVLVSASTVKMLRIGWHKTAAALESTGQLMLMPGDYAVLMYHPGLDWN
jgi:hypothetical protein